MSAAFQSHVFKDKLPSGEPLSFRLLRLDGCVFVWVTTGSSNCEGSGDAQLPSMTNLSFSLATRFDSESGGLPMSRRILSRNASWDCVDDPIPRMASKLAKVISRLAGEPKQVFLSVDLGQAGKYMGSSLVTSDMLLTHDPFAFVESRIVKEIKENPHVV